MLLFLDGFDHYATADITDGWTQIYSGDASKVTISPGNGRRGTNCLRIGPGLGAPVGIAGLGSTVDTVIVGFSFRLSGVSTSWSSVPNWTMPTNGVVRPGPIPILSWPLASILNLREGGYTQLALMPHTNGLLSVVRCGEGTGFWDGPTHVLGTTTSALQANETYYLELKAKIHDTAGTVELRVNGDVWLLVTGVKTQGVNYIQPNRIDEIVLGRQAFDGGSGTECWDYDDLYIADTNASNVDNTVVDFLGDVALTWRAPTADGAMTGWTPSGGARYQNVDDLAPDDDATYNGTLTVGATDTFPIQDAPVSSVGVVAMAVVHAARRTEGGNTSTAGVIRIGTTNYAGTARGNTSTYSYHQFIVNRKPSDHSAITAADFNAMEVGYRKVT